MIKLKNNRNKCFCFDINPNPSQESAWSGIREIMIKPGINEITDGDYVILEPQIYNHLNSKANAITDLNIKIEDANYKGLTTLKTELEKELAIVEAGTPVFELVV